MLTRLLHKLSIPFGPGLFSKRLSMNEMQRYSVRVNDT